MMFHYLYSHHQYLSMYLVHSSSLIYHSSVVVVTLPLSSNNNKKKNHHHRWYQHILQSPTSVTENPQRKSIHAASIYQHSLYMLIVTIHHHHPYIHHYNYQSYPSITVCLLPSIYSSIYHLIKLMMENNNYNTIDIDFIISIHTTTHEVSSSQTSVAAHTTSSTSSQQLLLLLSLPSLSLGTPYRGRQTDRQIDSNELIRFIDTMITMCSCRHKAW